MAYTEVKVIYGAGPNGLNDAISDAIAAGYQPIGDVITQENSAYLLQAVAKGTPDDGGSDSYTLPAATTSAIGGVKMATNQSNAGSSSATDVATLVSDFNTLATKYNGLLSALRAAGIMASA